MRRRPGERWSTTLTLTIPQISGERLSRLPSILCWQLFNTDLDIDGTHRGFWMIDYDGVKLPIFETHRRHFNCAEEHVADFKRRIGRSPNDTEFRTAALDHLDRKKDGR